MWELVERAAEDGRKTRLEYCGDQVILTGERLPSSNVPAFLQRVGELAENRVAEMPVSLLAAECSGGGFCGDCSRALP